MLAEENICRIHCGGGQLYEYIVSGARPLQIDILKL
jgi:hypothetical protein